MRTSSKRLMPALRIVGDAIRAWRTQGGRALIKVIDRLDKHQNTVVAKYVYGPEERQRLLDKINQIADRLQPPAEPILAEEGDENISGEIPV